MLEIAVEDTPGEVGLPVALVRVDTGLSHLDRPFEYQVPPELAARARVGARVKVRFAGQDLGGYVVGRAARAEHQGRLAPLRTVVSDEPVLTPAVLRLAERLAEQQAGSVSDVLRLAVPPRHARAEKALPLEPEQATGPQATVVERSSAWARYRAGEAWWSRVRGGESPRAALLVSPTTDPALDWPVALAEAALATTGSGRGSLLVVPDRRDLDRVDAALTSVLGPGQHVVLHADQGPQARYTAWLKVLRGHVRVVVGTRSAAFAPVRDLGLVAWWDDGDDLHVEPRAPYQHVRDVLLVRADLEGAAALTAGYSVSTDVMALVEAGELVAIGGLAERRAAARVLVAGEGHDAERDGPAARAHLPSAAWRAAKEALTTGPVLVQVPRRGYAPSTRCASCREAARCPTCHGPLALRGAREQPACRWCGVVAAGWRCPECDGHELRASVVGAKRTAEEIGRAFPGVPVIRSGAPDVVATVPDAPAVVIATPGAEPVTQSGYAAALLLDAWALLDRPSLRAGEESLRRWLGAAALVRPWSDGGTVVLGGAPDHTTQAPVEALVRWDPAWYAARELAERAELGLPPTRWTAEVVGGRDRLRELRDELTTLGADAIGPTPAPGGAQDGERLVVRAGGAVATTVRDRLHDLRATDSGRKVSDPLRVRVGPHVLD